MMDIVAALLILGIALELFTFFYERFRKPVAPEVMDRFLRSLDSAAILEGRRMAARLFQDEVRRV